MQAPIPRILSTCALAAAACATPAPGPVLEVAPDLRGAKADWAPIGLADDYLSFSSEVELAREQENGADHFVLRVTLSEEMADVGAYFRSPLAPTPEPIGEVEAEVEGGTDIAVRLTPSEARRVLDGGILVLTMTPADEDRPPYAARFLLRARVATLFTEDLSLNLDLEPVLAGAEIAYRLRGKAPKYSSIAGFVAGREFAPVEDLDDEHFQVDLEASTVDALLGTGKEFEITHLETTGTLALAVGHVELRETDRGANAWYVRSECYPGITNCLKALPADALDVTACGLPLDILQCRDATGVRATRELLDAVAASDAPTRAEAEAVVGPQRAAALQAAVTAQVQRRLDVLEGRWFPNDAAARHGLAHEVDRVIGRAYAWPFELVEALPLRPGPDRLANDVAADRLVKQLGVEDLAHNEYEAPIDHILMDDESRAESVEVLRQIRAGECDVETHEGVTSYFTSWLGAYVAIDVYSDRDAGIDFEVD